MTMNSTSVWPVAAAVSPGCTVPFTEPGGNPVNAVPGLTPRSPLTTVGPVLVTVDVSVVVAVELSLPVMSLP